MIQSVNFNNIIKGEPVQSRLPQELSDSWLKSLKLIEVPNDSLHYVGRELVATLKELEQKMERDDPSEEYKVKPFPGCSQEIVCSLNLFIYCLYIFFSKHVHELLSVLVFVTIRFMCKVNF